MAEQPSRRRFFISSPCVMMDCGMTESVVIQNVMMKSVVMQHVMIKRVVMQRVMMKCVMTNASNADTGVLFPVPILLWIGSQEPVSSSFRFGLGRRIMSFRRIRFESQDHIPLPDPF